MPVQRPLGSASLLAATQVWLVGSHAMQVPVQSLLVQQSPLGMHVVVPPTVHAVVVLASQV